MSSNNGYHDAFEWPPLFHGDTNASPSASLYLVSDQDHPSPAGAEELLNFDASNGSFDATTIPVLAATCECPAGEDNESSDEERGRTPARADDDFDEDDEVLDQILKLLFLAIVSLLMAWMLTRGTTALSVAGDGFR